MREKGPDGASLLTHVVVHGAIYVGSCVIRGHGASWQVRRPLWESLVRLESAGYLRRVADRDGHAMHELVCDEGPYFRVLRVEVEGLEGVPLARAWVPSLPLVVGGPFSAFPWAGPVQPFTVTNPTPASTSRRASSRFWPSGLRP